MLVPGRVQAGPTHGPPNKRPGASFDLGDAKLVSACSTGATCCALSPHEVRTGPGCCCPVLLHPCPRARWEVQARQPHPCPAPCTGAQALLRGLAGVSSRSLHTHCAPSPAAAHSLPPPPVGCPGLTLSPPDPGVREAPICQGDPPGLPEDHGPSPALAAIPSLAHHGSLQTPDSVHFI